MFISQKTLDNITLEFGQCNDNPLINVKRTSTDPAALNVSTPTLVRQYFEGFDNKFLLYDFDYARDKSFIMLGR